MSTFSISFENYIVIIHENTLFNPLNVWNVGAHIHSFYETRYIIEGNATLLIDNQMVELNKHDLIFINKNVLHYSPKHSSDLKFATLSFGLEKNTNATNTSFDYNQVKKCLHSTPSFLVIKNKIFINIFEELYQNQSAKNSQIALHSYSTLIFLTLMNCLYKQNIPLTEELPRERSSKYKNEIIKIDKYISTHYMENITLKDLAKDFYLSERQMARIFMDLVGESFHKSLLRQRMNIAGMHIKNNNVPLTEIPFLCGFNSYSGFYIAFKNFFGITPQEYKDLILSSESPQRS